MADPKKSVYARLASRFAGLALGAKEEEEEDKDASAEDEGDDEEAKEDERAEKPKGKKAKKGGKDCPTSEEDEDDEEAAEDEDDDEKKAAASERGRWTAVLSSSEAKGRVPLACSLLADTDMNAEKICAALLASPVEGRHGLAARMATVQRPEVGSPAVPPPNASTPKGRANEIVAAYNKAVGR